MSSSRLHKPASKQMPETRNCDTRTPTWLNARECSRGKQVQLKRVAILLEASSDHFEHLVLFECSHVLPDNLQAKETLGEGVETRMKFDGLAPMLLDHSTATGSNGELPSEVVDRIEEHDAHGELLDTW